MFQNMAAPTKEKTIAEILKDKMPCENQSPEEFLKVHEEALAEATHSRAFSPDFDRRELVAKLG